MPTIDLTQVYSNADDSPAIDMDTKKPVTLKQMLINALLADGDSGSTEGDKMKRYSLYRDVKKAKDSLTLSIEDVAVLKKAANIFPVLTMGQTHDMLENPYTPPSPDPT